MSKKMLSRKTCLRLGWRWRDADIDLGIAAAGDFRTAFGRGMVRAYNVRWADGDKGNTAMRAMTDIDETTYEVACPDCGATLKIDVATRAVISHTPAPRKRTFEDMETAAKAMREQDVRRESIFKQAVENEKNKEDLMNKRFAEALRKAKETPDTGKPLRDFDLD
jgi:hypothetical protein